MTREEIRLQVAVSALQGVLEAKLGVVGEALPSVAVEESLRIADEFVKQWFKEKGEKEETVVTQSKQECSAEVEKKISELKTFIAQCNGFNKENRKKAFDMIDALRPKPHWKPSEKQINMLKVIVEREKEKPLYGIDGYSPAGILESLYTDLQKLL